jgi:hypothetical protein
MDGRKERKEEEAERLSPREDACLKAAKEIAVKFIETGRISLAAFPGAFAQVYRGVKNAVDGRD